ncbi:MAG: YitT family protein [Roseitalea porphyridii]|uniref:YitT family protein n=1 Tax=Roseitalea porphyridii TaxID=1852022 RepID=UPI0032D8C7EA
MTGKHEKGPDPMNTDTASGAGASEAGTRSTPDVMMIRPSRHTLPEDVFAITIGVALVSFGVFLFQQAELVVSGVAGIALALSYATGLDFSVLFFSLNLPFYALAVGGMGWRFVIKTFCAIALMSVLVRSYPALIDIAALEPAFAGLIGGIMIGLGLLALFRHGAGLGGINILVYWLQSTRGLRAGYVQLGIDAVILAGAALVIGWQGIIWSVAGAVMFNLILGVNHKPGRYVGVS